MTVFARKHLQKVVTDASVHLVFRAETVRRWARPATQGFVVKAAASTDQVEGWIATAPSAEQVFAVKRR